MRGRRGPGALCRPLAPADGHPYGVQRASYGVRADAPGPRGGRERGRRDGGVLAQLRRTEAARGIDEEGAEEALAAGRDEHRLAQPVQALETGEHVPVLV